VHTVLRQLIPVFALALPVAAQERVVVSTGAIEITLSPRGGVPIAWTVVPTADEPPKQPGALDLMDPDHVRRVGFHPLALWLGGDGPDDRQYEVRRSTEGGDTTVVFTARDAGLGITKTYRFEQGSHLFTLSIRIENTGSVPAQLGTAEAGPGITLGAGLGYGPDTRPDLHNERFLTPVVVPFVHTAAGTISIEPPTQAPFEVALPATSMTFGGMQAPFTCVAIVPDPDTGPFDSGTITVTGTGESDAVREGDLFQPEMVLRHAPMSLAPGEATTLRYQVFGGPKKRQLLQATGLGLESLLLNYLWPWFVVLCQAIETVLLGLEGLLGSWGLALIVFAIAFRIVVLPLSIYGARQQMLMKAKMAELKPLIAELKSKYAKNADKRHEAILKLYKEHGVNPLSHSKGCLPLFIQLPILIALVQVMLNSYDLLGASFLWIHDLTRTDMLFELGFQIPWLGGAVNLLPLIMFAAMIIVGVIMARAEGKKPGPALLGLPVAMTLLFYPFPSGCMLFWVTGTVLQIVE